MHKIIITISIGLLLTANASMASIESYNQSPKGRSMKLVAYTPVMMDTPFRLEYPECWYVREEYAGGGRAGVFLTREEIKRNEDKYLVGITVAVKPNAFVEVSNLTYEEKMGRVLMDITKKVKVLKSKELNIDGHRGNKFYIESENKKGILVTFILGNHLYLFDFSTPKNEYGVYASNFEKMISAFRWLPSKKIPGYQPQARDSVMEAIIDDKPRKMIVDGKEKEASLGSVIREFANKSTDTKINKNLSGDYSDGWNKPIQIAFDENEWKLKVKKRGQYRELKQYFHPQETVQNWTELLAVERLVGPMVSQVTPERISKAVQSKAQIVSTSPKEVQYAGHSDNKTRFDFVRVIITKDVVFTLTYATRNPENQDSITKWKKIIQLAGVE